MMRNSLGSIHPSATVDRHAELGSDVTIGPGAVIGSLVRIGAGSYVGPHVILDGRVCMGEKCQIYPHAVIGTPPQDVTYRDEPTRVEIGDRNIIREFVTVHRGTNRGGGVTRIGSNVYLMAYCHVAHDNFICDHVIVANGAQLGGHVQLGEHVVVGAVSAIHQFVRVGSHAFLGGGSTVTMDVAPFCRATGNRAKLHGLNTVGLRRRGFGDDDIKALKGAYRLAFNSNLLAQEAADRIEHEYALRCAPLHELIKFLRTSTRGLTR
jgi:UDP-N-acetylglucosamine acyltransferase